MGKNNRTIRFRGYNKKNGVWLYGFYLQNRGAHFVAPDEFADGKSWDDYEIDIESLGQFTGLQDIDGNDIYVGDAVVWKDGLKYLVTFWEGMFYASVEEFNDGIHGGYPLWVLCDVNDAWKPCRIVGNSYNTEKDGKTEFQ